MKIWKKYFCILLFLFIPILVRADYDPLNSPPENEYFRAKVIKIITDDGRSTTSTFTYQNILVKPFEGTFKDKEILVTQEAIRGIYGTKEIQEGETLVIWRNTLNNPEFLIEDKFRLQWVITIIGIFFFCVIVFTGKKGIRSILSLIITLLLVIYFIVPQIAHGANPLLVSFISAILLLLLSIYLGHGINKRSTIALISSFSVIGLSLFLGVLFIHLSKLFGQGSNEAVLLQYGNLGEINIRGLLLAGIVLSTIGILDDVTVVQSATVEEIFETDKTIETKILYKKAMSVGKEHIISMANTLIIAYTGAALPLLLFFTYQTNAYMPLWVKLNSEAIGEEIVRSIVGSIVLIFAVPITTWIAAKAYTNKKIEIN